MENVLTGIVVVIITCGVLGGIIVFVKVFLGSDKASVKSLENAKLEILRAASASVDDVKGYVSENFAMLGTVKDYANEAFANADSSAKKAIEAERLKWQAGDNENNRLMGDKVTSEVGKVCLIAERKADKVDLDQQIKKIAEDSKTALDKLRDEMKSADQALFDRLTRLLNDQDQTQQVIGLKKALEEFKTATLAKAEEARKASGVFYPIEVLVEKLEISTDIAQKFIDASYDSVEKIAQAEVVALIVTLQGIVEAKDILAIHKKAQEVISIQENVAEIKAGAKVTENADGILTFVEEEKK